MGLTQNDYFIAEMYTIIIALGTPRLSLRLANPQTSLTLFLYKRLADFSREYLDK